jgi:hypothetical protein
VERRDDRAVLFDVDAMLWWIDQCVHRWMPREYIRGSEHVPRVFGAPMSRVEYAKEGG